MVIGITGARGFIVNLLVEKHLEIGNKVHILSRKIDNKIDGVHFYLGNLLDLESLDSFVESIVVL